MDNLEELLKKYNELLSKTDDKSLFELFDIITCLQDEDKLEDFLDKHKTQLLTNDPVLFIGKHVHFYLCNDDIFKALDVLKTYQEAPFINLTTEEFMKELEKEIKDTAFPKKKKEYDDQEMMVDLVSNNSEKVAKSIKYLSESNVRKYLDFIQDKMLSNLDYNYKILLQFILIEQKVDDTFKVLKKDGTTFEFNPSKTQLPFQTKEYFECINYLNSLNESPSIIKWATEILNTVQVKKFPDSILKMGYSSLVVGEILIYLAKQYMQEENDVVSLTKNTELSIEEINDFIAKINECLY